MAANGDPDGGIGHFGESGAIPHGGTSATKLMLLAKLSPRKANGAGNFSTVGLGWRGGVTGGAGGGGFLIAFCGASHARPSRYCCSVAALVPLSEASWSYSCEDALCCAASFACASSAASLARSSAVLASARGSHRRHRRESVGQRAGPRGLLTPALFLALHQLAPGARWRAPLHCQGRRGPDRRSSRVEAIRAQDGRPQFLTHR